MSAESIQSLYVPEKAPSNQAKPGDAEQPELALAERPVQELTWLPAPEDTGAIVSLTEGLADDASDNASNVTQESVGTLSQQFFKKTGVEIPLGIPMQPLTEALPPEPAVADNSTTTEEAPVVVAATDTITQSVDAADANTDERTTDAEVYEFETFFDNSPNRQLAAEMGPGYMLHEAMTPEQAQDRIEITKALETDPSVRRTLVMDSMDTLDEITRKLSLAKSLLSPEDFKQYARIVNGGVNKMVSSRVKAALEIDSVRDIAIQRPVASEEKKGLIARARDSQVERERFPRVTKARAVLVDAMSRSLPTFEKRLGDDAMQGMLDEVDFVHFSQGSGELGQAMVFLAVNGAKTVEDDNSLTPSIKENRLTALRGLYERGQERRVIATAMMDAGNNALLSRIENGHTKDNTAERIAPFKSVDVPWSVEDAIDAYRQAVEIDSTMQKPETAASFIEEIRHINASIETGIMSSEDLVTKARPEMIDTAMENVGIFVKAQLLKKLESDAVTAHRSLNSVDADTLESSANRWLVGIKSQLPQLIKTSYALHESLTGNGVPTEIADKVSAEILAARCLQTLPEYILPHGATGVDLEASRMLEDVTYEASIARTPQAEENAAQHFRGLSTVVPNVLVEYAQVNNSGGEDAIYISSPDAAKPHTSINALRGDYLVQKR